ncbi:leucine-rich repeat domain-containing protein [Pseudomonas tructae]|uniref:Leucine-rich repeat domain-containing protein n=1 Tax=Pseudomonas tructae TaxID=2518644 RepID=A0A411MCW2_9PSED|nr:leucine-rich repeat domain-containing protein [Pseudomonas tructae]QBF24519.1 leucine-rich repeat domain-containing protein [Pseudomonas tructae]
MPSPIGQTNPPTAYTNSLENDTRSIKQQILRDRLQVLPSTPAMKLEALIGFLQADADCKSDLNRPLAKRVLDSMSDRPDEPWCQGLLVELVAMNGGPALSSSRYCLSVIDPTSSSWSSTPARSDTQAALIIDIEEGLLSCNMTHDIHLRLMGEELAQATTSIWYSINDVNPLQVLLQVAEHLQDLTEWAGASEQRAKVARTIISCMPGLAKDSGGKTQLLDLRNLDLQSADLRDFPRLRSPLTHIQILDLGENRLDQYPYALLTNLAQLHTLGAPDNDLPTLPTELPVQNLSRLNLRDNNIRLDEASQAWLSTAKGLTWMDLSDNTLGRTPDLHGLSKLVTFDLSTCSLNSLPGGLESLQHLKQAYIRDNRIQTLPDWSRTLPSATANAIDVSGNPLGTEALESVRACYDACLTDLMLAPNATQDQPFTQAQQQILTELRKPGSMMLFRALQSWSETIDASITPKSFNRRTDAVLQWLQTLNSPDRERAMAQQCFEKLEQHMCIAQIYQQPQPPTVTQRLFELTLASVHKQILDSLIDQRIDSDALPVLRLYIHSKVVERTGLSWPGAPLPGETCKISSSLSQTVSERVLNELSEYLLACTPDDPETLDLLLEQESWSEHLHSLDPALTASQQALELAMEQAQSGQGAEQALLETARQLSMAFIDRQKDLTLKIYQDL